jgi:hypothetical protein
VDEEEMQVDHPVVVERKAAKTPKKSKKKRKKANGVSGTEVEPNNQVTTANEGDEPAKKKKKQKVKT